LCGAAIYIAAIKLKNPRSQDDVARVVGVSEVTLRTRIKDFYDILDGGSAMVAPKKEIVES
jgi:transcription initiation factor TFIIIB Brf1 subunit/transcription initiation factor TFIIB